MEQYIVNEANRLKNQAGKELNDWLTLKFSELVEQGVLKNFKGKTNYQHTGFSYEYQYKTNFVLETLDDKFVIINTSNSFRDRYKQDLYDFQGIMQHANISKDIIAAVLLYPDEEFSGNKSLNKYRSNVINKIAYCPATHILSFCELLEFLDNHRVDVELDLEDVEEVPFIINGSYAGVKGNEFEKEVVDILCKHENLMLLKSKSNKVCGIYESIISKLAIDNGFDIRDVISVEATNTVKKLASGGNAKTDVIVKINTVSGFLIETISIKNTTKNAVSCHDYKAEDFIRVLDANDSKLAKYFELYQHHGSNKKFEDGLPVGYSVEEFESFIKDKYEILMSWVLTGQYDERNLIEPHTQISNYLLINKSGTTRFIDYKSYIKEIHEHSKLTYGIPLGWTYPSKQRGSRIQLKLPIIV